MAFSGYLIKLGGSSGTTLPLTYMKYETYKITPNQRMDLDSTRNTLGELVRNVLAHTATKVEFDTVPMNYDQQTAFMTLLNNAWSNSQERRITLYYYDMETNSYKTGTFYVPDIQWTIRNIEGNNKLNYNPARIAFIEY